MRYSRLKDYKENVAERFINPDIVASWRSSRYHAELMEDMRRNDES